MDINKRIYQMSKGKNGMPKFASLLDNDYDDKDISLIFK